MSLQADNKVLQKNTDILPHLRLISFGDATNFSRSIIFIGILKEFKMRHMKNFIQSKLHFVRKIFTAFSVYRWSERIIIFCRFRTWMNILNKIITFLLYIMYTPLSKWQKNPQLQYHLIRINLSDDFSNSTAFTFKFNNKCSELEHKISNLLWYFFKQWYFFWLATSKANKWRFTVTILCPWAMHWTGPSLQNAHKQMIQTALYY